MSKRSQAKQRRIPGLNVRAKLGSRFVKIWKNRKLTIPLLGYGGNNTNHWHKLLRSLHPSETRRANWEAIVTSRGGKTRRQRLEMKLKQIATAA